MKRLALGTSLFAFGIIVAARPTGAAMVNNGDPIGPNYKIGSIDAGVGVDFTATAPDPSNSNTIGKLTVTMGHTNTNALGFHLTENAPAAASSSASGGLRLLMDVKDTNGMTLDWIDYHIVATDNAENVNAIRQTLMPNEGTHSVEAHFHGGPGSPLVIQGIDDNVTALNYGLGSP